MLGISQPTHRLLPSTHPFSNGDGDGDEASAAERWGAFLHLSREFSFDTLRPRVSESQQPPLPPIAKFSSLKPDFSLNREHVWPRSEAVAQPGILSSG